MMNTMQADKLNMEELITINGGGFWDTLKVVLAIYKNKAECVGENLEWELEQAKQGCMEGLMASGGISPSTPLECYVRVMRNIIMNKDQRPHKNIW